MSYVERVLQPGETVRHTATIHWIVYWPGVMFAVAGLAVWGFGEFNDHGNMFWQVVAGLLWVVALFLLVPEWFTWWTTEIAVTNRRIIFKQGFIRRSTMEMHMDKVESVDVDQSIFGRLLDYGDITVHGTGEGWETLRGISAPLVFRNYVTAR